MEPRPEMTPLPITADGADAFAPVWAVFEAGVLAQVERLTDSEADQDDLIQEAKCRLLELDPTGIDVERPADIAHVQEELRQRVAAVWQEGRRICSTVRTERRAPRRRRRARAAEVPVEQVKRVVEEAHAERNASPDMRYKIEEHRRVIANVEADNADLLRAPRGWDGRAVFGTFASTSIAGLSLALLASWYNYGQGGYCTRLGWDGLVRHSSKSAALVKNYCVSESGVPEVGAHMASAALVNAVDDPQPEYPKPRRKKA